MKKLMGILILNAILFTSRTNAETYYVSTTGSDSNPGTLSSPFKTWQAGASVLRPGDTLLIRGGTYTSPLSPGAGDCVVIVQNLKGTSSNHIVISAYPGEQPILDLAGFDQARNTTVIRVNKCSWVEFIGLWVWNMKQHTGFITAGWEFHECKDITMSRCWVHNIGGAGIRQAQKNGNDVINNDRFTYINCDASWCGDPVSTGGGNYGNADGFDANSGTATYINCRAWWNSDDGFDTYYNDAHVYYKNCWSFRNGYVPGTFTDPGAQADGMGFKWGVTRTDHSGNTLRTYTNCIAFDNKSWGFDQNLGKCRAEFYNNTSYRNKVGGWATGYGISPREQCVLKNNISFSDPVTVSDMTGLVHDHNTWNNLAASSSSFASLDTSGVTRSRQSDGSLPNLQFLHLSAGSDMINAGTSVGNSLFSGSAPDLGAFEYGGSSPSNQPPIANAGKSQVIESPSNRTVLDGSASRDADGDIKSYKWSQVSGPSPASILDPRTDTTNVTTLTRGVYKFELVVTDNKGAKARDTVTVTVNKSTTANQNPNKLPVANAGSNVTIALPTNKVTLKGSGYDNDGTVSFYQWDKISGPVCDIEDPSQPQTEVTGLSQGIYVFELLIKDNKGAKGKDTVTITVKKANDANKPNQLPVANAGPNVTITLPINKVTLKGNGSDNDGTVASYQWDQISGPNCNIKNPDQANTVVDNLSEGAYVFELVIRDNQNGVARDTVQLIVKAADSPIQNDPGVVNNNGSSINTPSFTIYPNPVSDKFSLAINNTSMGQLKVDLVNQAGALVGSFMFNKDQDSIHIELTAQNLASGIYFVRVTIRNWNDVRKIVKL